MALLLIRCDARDVNLKALAFPITGEDMRLELLYASNLERIDKHPSV